MKFREMFEQFAGRLKEVLGRMTSSQRMSLGMLSGVVALALVLLVIFSLGSAGGGWDKLFYTTLEPDQQQYVIGKLGTEEFRIEDGVIMVRASQRPRLAAMFLEDQKVNSEPDFFSSLFEPNFIETDRLRDIRYVHARENDLAFTISSYYKQVRRAKVNINRGDSGALMNLDQRKPTASVVVELAPGVRRLPNNTVRAIAATVSGPIRGLNPADVKISDSNGYPYKVDSDEDGCGYDSEQIAMTQAVDEIIENKVLKVIDISGVGIAVTTKWNWDKKITRIEKVTGDVPTKTSTEKVVSGSGEGTGGPVGVQPNNTGSPDIGFDTGSSKPAEPGYMRETKTVEPLNNAISREIEDVVKAGAELTDVTIGLAIPYNYLATPSSGGEMPTDPAQQEQNVQQKIKIIVDLVKNATGIADESKISVMAKPVFEKEEMPEESMVSTVWQDFSPYLGKAFIALIAFGSLLLVASFVKKNIPKPQQIPIEEIEMKIEQEVAKEKKDFLSELSKLDESEMKAIQVKDRVQEMVDENPENAATLLKTWINKEE